MPGKRINLDFCFQFNYPKEIEELLKKIIQVLDIRGILSVIALGTLPRGELSFRLVDKKLQLFSDIEFVIIADGRINKKQQIILKRQLQELAKEFQPNNPFFDIAVEFFSLRKFKKLPFKVRFYELKESGKVLLGQDVRNLIPEFNWGNRQIKDANNIILRRLFSILLHFPKQLFDLEKNNSAREAFKYVLARNSLDIATVILFEKGIFLSTYKDKVDYIISNQSNFINDFGPDFPIFFKKCLKIKLEMDFSQDFLGLFEDTIENLKRLLAYILRKNGVKVNKSLLSVIKNTKKDIFGEKDITTVKAKFIFKSFNINIFWRRLKSFQYSFLGCIIFFLVNMNEAVYLFLRGDKRSLSVLDDSWWILTRLGLLSGSEPLPLDFINRFLILREKFFLNFYLKFMNPLMSQQIKKVLNFNYE